MKLLGLPAHVESTKLPLSALLSHLKKSLENNYPVLAADVRHMVVITGYNAETKKIFVWNQWGNGKVINGMPKGHYELQETDLPIEFRYLVFCRRVRYEPNPEVKAHLEAITGPTEDLQAHPFHGTSPEYFLSHAGPERLKAALRANRVVLIPNGDAVWWIKPNEAKTNSAILTCISYPPGETTFQPLQKMAGIITSAGSGTFYSAKAPEIQRQAGLSSPGDASQ